MASRESLFAEKIMTTETTIQTSSKSSTLQSVAWFFFCAGFFTATWDRLLTVEMAGLTIKIYYYFFLTSFLCLFFSAPREVTLKIQRALYSRFSSLILLLLIYYLLLISRSYFPKKTLIYSAWLLFDLFCIWTPALILAERVKISNLVRLVAVTLIFHSLVIFLDHAAFYQGFRDGWIGFNQDHDLRWGVSRPAAFSYEPSYIASFLAFGSIFLLPWIKEKNAWALAAISCAVLAIFFSTSRTGVAAVFLGAGLFVLAEAWFRKRIPWKIIGASALFLAAVISLFYFSKPIMERKELDRQLMSSLIKGNDGSGVTRMKALGFAQQIVAETNWLGAGLGASFRYWVLNHDRRFLFDAEGKDLNVSQFGEEVIMSTWGQILAEGGIPGVLLFLTAGLCFCRDLYRARNLRDSPEFTGALLAAVVLFFFILHWIGNIARVDVWVWYAVLGMVLAKQAKADNIKA